MMNCNKCGSEPKETDKLAWKCNSCGKAYGAKLSYLHKLTEKKNATNAASVLKCKECGEYLDNGNEKIFWKCSCGNVQCGKLSDYRGKSEAISTQMTQEQNKNKKKEIKFRIKYVLPISLICVLLIAGILVFNIIRKNQKYEDAINAYKNADYESAKELFSSLDNFRDSKSMLLETKIKIEESKDKTAPVIENLPHDLELYVGEGIDYKKWIKKNNIKAIDDVDGEVDILVDDTGIDYDTVSDYEVTDDYDTITVSATDKAGNTVTQTVDVFIGYYPTYDAYLTATNISGTSVKSNLNGEYLYNGIHISSEEITKLDKGSVYRSLAMQLMGFYVLGKSFYPNWRKDISLEIFGFKKKNTWKKMKPYVDKALPFINNEYPIGEILSKFNKLNCAEGKFDFEKRDFNFTIKNLTKAANQLGISEEMLGYILAYVDEYGGESTFKNNMYSLKLHFYNNRKLDTSDFKYYKNSTIKGNIFNEINPREYFYVATNLDKNKSLPTNMSTLDMYGYATYRGIKLAHSQNAVILLYGSGEKHKFDRNSDILYKSLKWNNDVWYKCLEDCKEYIVYKYKQNELVFYFNKNKKVIMIMYGRWLAY